jgi:DNA-directed RNA polymerase subunit F
LQDLNTCGLRGDEMIGKKIQKQEPVILAEVKEILSSRRESGELLYEQGIALDHARKFSRLKLKDAQDLVKELVEAGLREELAVKLADITPQSVQEIRMLFSKERFVADDEELGKIAAIIQKYGES